MTETDAPSAQADWTAGEPLLAYGHCATCGGRWLFPRAFCPYCGATGIRALAACGNGVVEAVTEVRRAPTPRWEALLPYTVVLVALTEGVRLLAHGASGLTVGDPVSNKFREIDGRLLPYFVATVSVQDATPPQ